MLKKLLTFNCFEREYEYFFEFVSKCEFLIKLFRMLHWLDANTTVEQAIRNKSKKLILVMLELLSRVKYEPD